MIRRKGLYSRIPRTAATSSVVPVADSHANRVKKFALLSRYAIILTPAEFEARFLGGSGLYGGHSSGLGLRSSMPDGPGPAAASSSHPGALDRGVPNKVVYRL